MFDIRLKSDPLFYSSSPCLPQVRSPFFFILSNFQPKLVSLFYSSNIIPNIKTYQIFPHFVPTQFPLFSSSLPIIPSSPFLFIRSAIDSSVWCHQTLFLAIDTLELSIFYPSSCPFFIHPRFAGLDVDTPGLLFTAVWGSAGCLALLLQRGADPLGDRAAAPQARNLEQCPFVAAAEERGTLEQLRETWLNLWWFQMVFLVEMFGWDGVNCWFISVMTGYFHGISGEWWWLLVNHGD